MKIDAKKFIIKALPFIIVGLIATKFGQAYRLSDGAAFTAKLMHIGGGFSLAFQNAMPSFHPFDLMIGAAFAGAFKAFMVVKAKNAKLKLKPDDVYDVFDIDLSGDPSDTPAAV